MSNLFFWKYHRKTLGPDNANCQTLVLNRLVIAVWIWVVSLLDSLINLATLRLCLSFVDLERINPYILKALEEVMLIFFLMNTTKPHLRPLLLSFLGIKASTRQLKGEKTYQNSRGWTTLGKFSTYKDNIGLGSTQGRGG